jgi:hypothetical protein
MGFWQAFGRGVIKLLVSLLVGFGVGLLVIGNAAKDNPDFWHGRDPPGGLLMGIGAGLLTAAGALIVLFFIPWWFRRSPPPPPQEPRG